MPSGRVRKRIEDCLSPVQVDAVHRLVRRVLREVPARLVEAALFGSRARRQARPDSDVDVLLIFRRLPPDREPHASHAEAIAAEVSARTGVPVTVWSVSLTDLGAGNRTPMLVDALEDGVPLWCEGRAVGPVRFTAADAVACATALLNRVSEGSEVFRRAVDGGDVAVAARRARDDIVRLCTAWLLLHGFTRPRRGEAVRRFAAMAFGAHPPSRPVATVLSWAARSFGPTGREEDLPLAPPPRGLESIPVAVDHLRRMIVAARRRLESTGSIPHRSTPVAVGRRAPLLHFREDAG